MRRRSFTFLLAGVAATLALACLSPTIPLPPPSLPSVFPGDEPGTVELRSAGGAFPNAVIVVYNASPAVPLERRVGGAQADGQGSWRAWVYANPGDTLEVTQEVESNRSQPATVRVPATLGLAPPGAAGGADGGADGG